MNTTESRLRPLGALALFLFIAAMWLYPAMTLKLAHQNDIAVHLRWIEQFHTALQDGWLLPRWAYAAQGGLGDPSFFYYQPLFYYISSLFLWLGFRPERALVLAAAVPFLMVAAVVFWYFLRRYPARSALLGAMFVVACPTLYFMSTHLAAFPWSLSIPFSLLFAAESMRDKPRARVIAALLCLICLSHLLSGMMTLLCTGFARLIVAPPRPSTWPAHLTWLGGIVLGLALAAFFVYPAVTQMALINPAGWEQGFNWRRCFALPLVSQFVHGTYWFGVQWPFALLCLGLVLLVLLPRSVRATATQPLSPGLVTARRIGWVALCALLLGSELAYPLYAYIGAMQKLQFPYRFMFVASILASIALAIQLSEGAWTRWSKAVRVAAVLLVLGQCGQAALLQLKIVKDGERMLTHEQYFSGRFGQPEYALGARGPQWKEYAENGSQAHDCRRAGVACSAVDKRSHSYALTVDAPRAASLRLPVFGFPAWQATVDGRVQDWRLDADTGAIVLDLPAGRHDVALHYVRLPVEVAGLWVSAGALLVWLALVLLARRRKDGVAATSADSAPQRELKRA
ncbi:hypothetical protein [Massilia sp.]|uniref:hypothetical protein n=1 Tax=Massilia sp. TaxID=1882437 RepID=UPI002899ABA1|nr:hypothetical protein [Massilia sp.]